MPQSLSRVLVHVVFSTKGRDLTIPPAIRPRLHAYLATVLDGLDCPSLQVGGTGDHIHALFALGRTVTIADVVKKTKTSSSQWMKKQLRCAFWWQSGYGAFSVSNSQKTRVIKYIQQQESHHRRRTFQDEFRTLLKHCGIEWDESYVWD